MLVPAKTLAGIDFLPQPAGRLIAGGKISSVRGEAGRLP